VQVQYDEGVANRIGPEPCVGVREGAGEASVGVRIGQPSSRERHVILGADVFVPTEGDTGERAIASASSARRGLRTWHVRKLSAREPGGLSPIRGAHAPPDRVGKVRSRSRR